MYGGDEPSTPSPPVRSQVLQQQQQHREVYVGDELPPRSTSTRKKMKEPAPSAAPPAIVSTKMQHSPPGASNEHTRSFSVTGDDIEAAFDAINDYKTSTTESASNRPKEHEPSSPDSLFGLSTIKEAIDTDDTLHSTHSARYQQEEIDDIDFDNCFNKYKQQNQTKLVEEKPNKAIAPPPQPAIERSQKSHEPKSARRSKDEKRTAPTPPSEVRPSTISIVTPKMETPPTPTVTVSTVKQQEPLSNPFDDSNDSIDEDVDELLGKLEVSIP